MSQNFQTVDDYFLSLDPSVRKILEEIREMLKETLPSAKEKISWGMPTYHDKENLVHFFAHKNHVGFYPGDSGVVAFAEELKACGYKFTKGAIQFPLKDKMPLELMKRIAKFRLSQAEKNHSTKENLRKKEQDV